MAKARTLKRLPDGTVDCTQDFGDQFDDVLDALHSNPSQQHGLTMPAMDQEACERAEAEFFRAVTKEVDQRISSTGMFIRSIAIDATDGQSYLVKAMDRAGRGFETLLTVDQLALMSRQFGADVGREAIDTIAQELLGAREKYFARMQ